jgi:hypothetical protein
MLRERHSAISIHTEKLKHRTGATGWEGYKGLVRTLLLTVTSG